MGVIIYTSDICAPCKATKSWLTAHNISYTEKIYQMIATEWN